MVGLPLTALAMNALHSFSFCLLFLIGVWVGRVNLIQFFFRGKYYISKPLTTYTLPHQHPDSPSTPPIAISGPDSSDPLYPARLPLHPSLEHCLARCHQLQGLGVGLVFHGLHPLSQGLRGVIGENRDGLLSQDRPRVQLLLQP